MTALRWKLLPSALLALLALVALPMRSAVVAGDEPHAPEVRAEVADVSLVVLREDPTGWLGRDVRFVLQFQTRQASWNPGPTRFGAGDWVAFSGWADEAFTWEPSVFHDPAARLFCRRGSAVDELLAQARPHERFELEGVVREVFFEEPWIEVTRARPLLELVGEGTILHVGRAFRFAEAAQWDLAIEQLERAASAPLPAHAREALDAKIVECGRLRDAAAAERGGLRR